MELSHYEYQLQEAYEFGESGNDSLESVEILNNKLLIICFQQIQQYKHHYNIYHLSNLSKPLLQTKYYEEETKILNHKNLLVIFDSRNQEITVFDIYIGTQYEIFKQVYRSYVLGSVQLFKTHSRDCFGFCVKGENFIHIFNTKKKRNHRIQKLQFDFVGQPQGNTYMLPIKNQYVKEYRECLLIFKLKILPSSLKIKNIRSLKLDFMHNDLLTNKVFSNQNHLLLLSGNQQQHANFKKGYVLRIKGKDQENRFFLMKKDIIEVDEKDVQNYSREGQLRIKVNQPFVRYKWSQHSQSIQTKYIQQEFPKKRFGSIFEQIITIDVKLNQETNFLFIKKYSNDISQ